MRGFRDPSWLKEKAGKGSCINYIFEDLKGYDYETLASLFVHVITQTDMNDSLFQDIEKAKAVTYCSSLHAEAKNKNKNNNK